MSTFIEKHTFSFIDIYRKFIELQPSVYFFQFNINRNFSIFAGKFIQAKIDVTSDNKELVLNNELQRVHLRLKSNRLSLNVNKT